jgi:hypothetical protein
MIGDRIDAYLEIEADDFGCSSLDRCGGLRKVYQLFGEERPKMIEVLNRELAA